MTLKITLLAGLLLLGGRASGAGETTAADYYVAPAGNDQDPGTAAQPFATIHRARDAVRDRIAAGLSANLTVLLRGGVYELSEPLLFDVRDSGTDAYSITYAAYPGETPVLSGGRKITGWQPGEGNVWTVELPDVKAGKWYFRGLFVNGQRAIRARTPNVDAATPHYRLVDSKPSTDLSRWEVQLAPGQAANWKNLRDVELVSLGQWDNTRKLLWSANPVTGIVELAPPHVKPVGQPCPGCQFFLENARVFLDEPGEWYLDRTNGVLTYWPRAGEDLQNAEVSAPRLTSLMEIRGGSARPVKNLHFTGIEWAHAELNLPTVGWMGNGGGGGMNDQGKWMLPESALAWQFAQKCSFQDSVIAHLNGCGLELGPGCGYNLIQGNQVFDIGDVGIGLRGGNSNNALVNYNSIVNNYIHACGQMYYSGLGLRVGLTPNTIVAHNLIEDMPWSGMQIGAAPNSTPTVCRDILVEFNHVRSVMKTLWDGGGIYTMGNQPGTTLRKNLVHDSRGIGIYLDEGSKGFLVERNVVYKTGQDLKLNGCERSWQTFTDNTFGEHAFYNGKVGVAQSFANERFSDEPSTTILEPKQLTVEAWIRPLAPPASKDPSAWLVNKNSDEFADGHYALLISHNQVGAYLNIGGGRENCYSAWSHGIPLKSNDWNHVAFTFDGAELTVYCNGVGQGTTAVNRPRSFGSGILRLGKRADGYNPSFNGLMDEIRIYNRALTVAELRAHFETPTAADQKTEPGLVGYWPFDDLKLKTDEVVDNAGPEEPYRSRFAASREARVERRVPVKSRDTASPSGAEPSRVTPKSDDGGTLRPSTSDR